MRVGLGQGAATAGMVADAIVRVRRSEPHRDFRSPTTFMGQRAALSQGRGPFVQTIVSAAVTLMRRAGGGLQ